MARVMFLLLFAIFWFDDKCIEGYNLFEGIGAGAYCHQRRPVQCCNKSLLETFTPRSKGRGSNPPDTKFFLFTLQNPTNPEFLHDCCGRLPQDTNYNPKHPTEIFVHGWLDGTCRTAWMREMRDQLFMKGKGEYNVILVDWTWGNTPDYALAASNNRPVGEQIAFVVNNIMAQTNITGEMFHIIGHSFGSHIAGFAGKNIPGLRRITANGIGFPYPIGDVDFYPNSGKNQEKNLQEIVTKFFKLDLLYGAFILSPVFYDHLIAIQYYKTSINPCGCQFLAVECQNYRSFKRGTCNSCGRRGTNCTVMGMDFELYYQKKDDEFHKYYLDTDPTCPYCNNKGIRLSGFSLRNDSTGCCTGSNLKNVC